MNDSIRISALALAGCIMAGNGLAAAAVPPLMGKTYELAPGDDPVEAFAAVGVSVTGASYEMTAHDGSKYRVDRAAAGRMGLVVVSRATRAGTARVEWTVTGVVPQAVDTSDAFTANCRAASGEIAFLYYRPEKSGAGIKSPQAGFRINAKSGQVEPAKLSAAECTPSP